MALFSKNSKKKETKAPADAKAGASQETQSGADAMRDVLRMPRITEKASVLAQRNIVVFEVSPSATKREIIDAVKKSYKVTPRAVRIVSIPLKSVRHMKTGRTGVKGGGKKAYVCLKEGDSISLA